MEIKLDDYIVITISSEDDAETRFLEQAGRMNNNEWYYAAMGPGCKNKLIKCPNGNTSNQGDSYSFYLINAKYWKCNDNKHDHKYNCNCKSKTPNEEICSLLKAIDSNNKNIIVWTHNTDNIACDTINKLFKNSTPHCNSFSHQSPYHAVETFMFDVCKNNENNFESEFKKLIEYSLKKNSKPHLIALSILCQGYLAAHGGNGLDGWKNLPENLRKIVQSKGNKKKTEERSWWKSALGDNYNAKDLNKELETVDKEKNQESIKSINCLIDIIKDGKVNNKDGTEIIYFVNGEDGEEKKLENGKVEEFTGKVGKAYGHIKDILATK